MRKIMLLILTSVLMMLCLSINTYAATVTVTVNAGDIGTLQEKTGVSNSGFYFERTGTNRVHIMGYDPSGNKIVDWTQDNYPSTANAWQNFGYGTVYRKMQYEVISGTFLLKYDNSYLDYTVQLGDNYPNFDPNYGINYNPLLKYWTLYKEVSNGKTYWNLMFTQFQNLYTGNNQIHFAGLGLWYRCENNASIWDLYQQYPTGSFIDGTIDTTIQTPKRSNHDIWDYTYTNIYFAKTDSVPATSTTGNPIQPIPKPVLELPNFNWTWDPSDPWGSIGSFLTESLNYLKDLIVNSFNYLGDLLKYVFLNSSSSGIDFTPLIVSVSNVTAKFPFSIPWDLKNAITSLQATPTPPNWTINFDSKYFKGGGNITIDFSQFETLAAVSRWGILILFNISLILLSKKLIGN